MWNHVEFRYPDKHPKKGIEPKFLDVCDETFASICQYVGSTTRGISRLMNETVLKMKNKGNVEVVIW